MAAGLEGEVEGGAGNGQVFQCRGFGVLHAECLVKAAGKMIFPFFTATAPTMGLGSV